jgi:threonine dehydrogenase-like Zn-dependent dehydrogenase
VNHPPIESTHAVWESGAFAFKKKQIVPGHRTILRVIACGCCGTDRHALKQAGAEGASIGHEMIGEIIHLGDNHKVVAGRALAIGDRVVLIPGKHCGLCLDCLSRSGRENLCGHRTKHGWSAYSESEFFPAGGFSTHIELMDDAWLHKIPDHIPDDIAALAEPLAIAVRAVDRALSANRPERDLGAAVAMRAAVIGVGSLGYLVAYVLKTLGAEVVGIDLSADKCALFTKLLGFPAVQVHLADASEIEAKLSSHGITHPLDVVFECGGSIEAFVASLMAVRRGGRVIELGNYIQDECAEIDPAWLCRKEIDVLGAVYANPFNYEKVFDVVAIGGVEALAGAITHKVPLERMNEIFLGPPVPGIKTLVTMN